MIKKEDLKVGLVTEEGYTVTAIGKKYLLYKMSSRDEACFPIDGFCKECTEQKEDEFIKVEVCNHKSFVVDGKMKLNIYIDNQLYNKTKGEFVKEIKWAN